MKNTKAIWLGKWVNYKTNPLHMKWIHITPATPVKILEVHFSYDKKRNADLINFSLKLRKLQKKKLDMWSARSLKLFGRVLITKIISQITYSASNIEVTDTIAGTLKKKLLNFIWEKERIKSNEPFLPTFRESCPTYD